MLRHLHNILGSAVGFDPGVTVKRIEYLADRSHIAVVVELSQEELLDLGGYKREVRANKRATRTAPIP